VAWLLYAINLQTLATAKPNTVVLPLQEQFEAAKGQMLRYGEISRHLLLSFWFYLQPSYDELHQMCEVVSAFELGYLVPQPDAPSATAFKEPFLVTRVPSLAPIYAEKCAAFP